MSELQEYVDLAQDLVSSYTERNNLFSNIDDMFDLEWDMPEGMPDWVIKVKSTDPRDTVTTVVRTFATIRPHFKVAPMLNNEANRNRANEIETAIAWNFKKAGRRKATTVEWDVLWSAAKYSEIAAQVIYLPYQIKILKAMTDPKKPSKGDKSIQAKIRRAEAALRFGDFAFIFHHPSNVYPEESEYGLEGVLTCKVQTIDQFMNSWGNLANKIDGLKTEEGTEVTYVTTWDYTNFEERCVWAICSDNSSARVEGSGDFILQEENKLGFIPYVVKRWGDALTDDGAMPLLESVYKSGQWNKLNVFESLDASLAIKRAAQPQYAAETPPGTDIEIDATEPISTAKLPAGTRNFTPLPAQSVDQRVAMQKAESKNDIWQTVAARILSTFEFPSGTAYSSVNQLLTQATNSISQCKLLGEIGLSELSHLMLCWGHYYDKEYGKGETSLYGQYEDKTNLGKEVSLAWDTINPDALDVEVTLTPNIPIDKLQQINGAVLLKQNFRVPEAELLEDIGLGDPNELAKRRDLDDYKQAYIQADLQRIAMAPQLEAQQQTMEMQAGIQQQQNDQAMAQEQAAREQEAALANAQNNASPAMEQMQGLMNNTAMGGNPSVTLARGQK